MTGSSTMLSKRVLETGTDLLAALAAVLQGKRFVSKGLDRNGFAPEKGQGEA
jgi:hypothetical protein